MATDPAIMKMRLAAIRKIIQDIPTKPDTKWLEHWEASAVRAESALANKIRVVFEGLPKGYTKSVPSLKNRAKTRFLQWRENQAKGAWKRMSESEQAVWIGYVEDGLEFGTIREKQLKVESTASNLSKMLRLQLDMLDGQHPLVAIPVEDLETLLDHLDSLDGSHANS